MPIRPVHRSLCSLAAAAALIAGCDTSTTSPAPAVAAKSPQTATTPQTDQWLGTWRGPEGTFLKIEGGNGKYAITIQDLDGPRTFEGRAEGERIAFERLGVKETLHATKGGETGMKWLSEKSDCLTVRTGEGYCRD